MKKVLLTIISICLIAASVFGLFAGVNGLQDVLSIKEYKEQDAEEGLEQINDVLLPGIAQLKENEDTYTNGVSTYEAGLITYQNGQAELAAGGATLAAGAADLAAGQAEYDAGVADLEAGKQAYAEGKAKIEANTAAYEAGKIKVAEGEAALAEGKATLAKIEPLMPYVNQYVEWRDSQFGSSHWLGFSTAQEWFMKVVRPIAASQGLTIPDNVNDLPAYIQNMVAEGKAAIEAGEAELAAGKAQLKEYEDGVAQLAAAEQQIAEGEAKLAAGKATLDAGYAAYAAGQQDYAAGKAQLEQGAQDLADGKAQLSVFEDGAAQVAAGLELLLSQPEYRSNEGKGDKVICPSVRALCEEKLGEDFTYWKLDDNGEILVMNGCQYVDLDVAEEIAYAARDYISIYQTESLTKELYSRMATYACLLLASVLGILAGLFGLLCIGKISGGKIGTATVCGYISAILAIAGNIVGLVTGYTGYAYPNKVVTGDTFEYVYTGHMQVTALIILAVVAVLFVVVASIVRHAYKASKATVAAEAAAAAAATVPVTAPVVEAAPAAEAAPVAEAAPETEA